MTSGLLVTKRTTSWRPGHHKRTTQLPFGVARELYYTSQAAIESIASKICPHRHKSRQAWRITSYASVNLLSIPCVTSLVLPALANKKNSPYSTNLPESY